MHFVVVAGRVLRSDGQFPGLVGDGPSVGHRDAGPFEGVGPGRLLRARRRGPGCRRRLFGGRLVQSGQEGGQGVGSLRGARDGGAVGRLARHPGGDDPGSWKQGGGLAEALRDGNRQRRRGAREGTQVCSLRSVTSADGVAQGKRTARSSPSRQSWLAQPRAPSLTG